MTDTNQINAAAGNAASSDRNQVNVVNGPVRVAWNIINLSHYHAARWTAFASRLDASPIVLELANRDSGIVTLEMAGDVAFERRTLFTDTTWDRVAGWRRARAIWRALDEIAPDVVCLNGWSMGGAPASLAWAISRGRHAIVMSESNQADFTRQRWVEGIKSRLTGLASAAVTGGSMAQDYLLRLGMPGDRIFLGYDVVDNSHFANGARNIRAGAFEFSKPFFLGVARFEEKKNHIRLLEAFALYRMRAGADAWSLVLLGDGKLRPELERQAVHLEVSDAVMMPGFTNYDELPAWYGAASCFIHPSVTEQWGLVVNEAMAAGLPVLVSERCGCAPELVREGVNGFTFDPHDVQGIADLMFCMAHGDNDRDAMGRASGEIISDWGPERFADGLTQAVQAALAAPPPQPTVLDKALLWALIHR